MYSLYRNGQLVRQGPLAVVAAGCHADPTGELIASKDPDRAFVRTVDGSWDARPADEKLFIDPDEHWPPLWMGRLTDLLNRTQR